MSKYIEDTSVEQSAIELFQHLNWETYNAYNEVLGEEGGLDREVAKRLRCYLYKKRGELPAQNTPLKVPLNASPPVSGGRDRQEEIFICTKFSILLTCPQSEKISTQRC